MDFHSHFNQLRDNVLNGIEDACKAFLISKGWDGKDLKQAQEIASKYERHIIPHHTENGIEFKVEFKEKEKPLDFKAFVDKVVDDYVDTVNVSESIKDELKSALKPAQNTLEET